MTLQWPIVITYDMPAAILSPNNRDSWRKRMVAVKFYRNYVKLVSIGWLNSRKLDRPRLEAAHVRIVFVFADRIRRDVDNFLGRFKSGIDGMVDAGIFMDDRNLMYTVDKEYAPNQEQHVRVEVTPK